MDVEFLRSSDKILTELDKSDLTKKGIIGSEINECNEILLTEIIESNILVTNMRVFNFESLHGVEVIKPFIPIYKA